MSNPSDIAALAKRYPSLAPGPKGTGAAAAPETPAPARPPNPATASADRLAKRYPSLSIEATSPAPETEPRPITAEQRRADEEARLAKRYPSLDLRAKEQDPAKADGAADPAPQAEKDSGLALDAPEGVDPKDPVFSDFRKAAGELGLDQGKAGRLLELHQRVIRGQQEAWDRQSEAWRKESEADPEITAGTEDLRRLVKGYGGRELIDALGPLGNHPVVVRSFARIAAAMKKAGQL